MLEDWVRCCNRRIESGFSEENKTKTNPCGSLTFVGCWHLSKPFGCDAVFFSPAFFLRFSFRASRYLGDKWNQAMVPKCSKTKTLWIQVKFQNTKNQWTSSKSTFFFAFFVTTYHLHIYFCKLLGEFSHHFNLQVIFGACPYFKKTTFWFYFAEIKRFKRGKNVHQQMPTTLPNRFGCHLC